MGEKKTRAPFKIAGITLIVLVVTAGASVTLANRPRNPSGSELEVVLNNKVCRLQPCKVPSGHDWYKTSKGPKGIDVTGTLTVPRAALKVGVPPSYDKPTGDVEIDIEGVLAIPEFKYFPTFAGEEADYLRPRPPAKLAANIKANWDKESVANLRTEIGLLLESLDPAIQAEARQLLVKLAGTRGTYEQLDDDMTRGFDPQELSEYPPLIVQLKSYHAAAKDPKIKARLADKIKEFERVVRKMDENAKRAAARGQGRPPQ